MLSYDEVTVTPEMAEEWLSKNGRNRRLNPKVVNLYARDMKSGAWLATGEAIKLGKDGTLLDGQHRLAAITKCGISQQMTVITGVEPEARSAMDTGRKRTAGDALTILGEKNGVQLAATIKLALGVEAEVPDPNKYEPTHNEIQEFLDANPEIRDSVNFTKPLVKRTDCTPAVVSYTHWILAGIDQEDADAFWTDMVDKVGLDRGDPILALAERFADIRRLQQYVPKRVYLSMIYRAWNARRKGQDMSLIRMKSPGGGFIPTPEPI